MSSIKTLERLIKKQTTFYKIDLHLKIRNFKHGILIHRFSFLNNMGNKVFNLTNLRI